jgi:hypothetical protein
VTGAVSIIDSCIHQLPAVGKHPGMEVEKSGIRFFVFGGVFSPFYSTPLHFVRLAGLAIPGKCTLYHVCLNMGDGSGLYSQFYIVEAIIFIRETVFGLSLYK